MPNNSSSSISPSPQRHKSSKKKSKSKKDSKREKMVKRCKEKRRSRTHLNSRTLQNVCDAAPNLEIEDVVSSVNIDTRSIPCPDMRNGIETDEVFGPALPPHLLKSSSVEKPMIGPQVPNNISNMITSSDSALVTASFRSEEDHVFGPVPPSSGVDDASMTATQLDLEQRALELKIAAIDGTHKTDVDPEKREEWMLELPEVGLKGGLAALSNMKRKFHHGRDKPDFSDRSVWTKMPQNDTNTTQPKSINSRTAAETMRNDAQAIYEHQRDKEQARMAKKYEKKHKRDESLVEIHKRKLREQEKKEKALATDKPERRPFSRDVDLKLIKIDKNQTKSIVDKAKILDTKFGSGRTKYL